jgi:hypothetical protein
MGGMLNKLRQGLRDLFNFHNDKTAGLKNPRALVPKVCLFYPLINNNFVVDFFGPKKASLYIF